MTNPIARLFATIRGKSIEHLDATAARTAAEQERAVAENMAEWARLDAALEACDKADAALEADPSPENAAALEGARTKREALRVIAETSNTAMEAAFTAHDKARAERDAARAAFEVGKARSAEQSAGDEANAAVNALVFALDSALAVGEAAVELSRGCVARHAERLDVETSNGALDVDELAALASADMVAATMPVLSIIAAADALRGKGVALLNIILDAQRDAARRARALGRAVVPLPDDFGAALLQELLNAGAEPAQGPPAEDAAAPLEGAPVEAAPLEEPAVRVEPDAIPTPRILH